MRKIKSSPWAALILAFLVALTGCITIETGGDTAGALVEVGARRVAYHAAIANPEIIEPGLAMCASIDGAMEQENQVDLKALLYQVFNLINSDFVKNDPLLVYEIGDLCEIIRIDTTQPIIDLDEDQLKYIQRGLNGFTVGLLIAQSALEKENG